MQATQTMTVESLESTFFAYWTSATSQQRALGRDWYRDARVQARAMASEHGCSLATACGVIAALSPRIHWIRNMTVARICLAGDTPTGVFRTSLKKAIAIRAGARPLRVLSGPKVRAFYRALMGQEQHAVVDVWIARAAGVFGSLREHVYTTIARALTRAAARARVTVSALQATVWVVARGRAL